MHINASDLLFQLNRVHCKATQLAAAETSQNQVRRAVRSDWSQSWRTGSLHSAISSDNLRSNEMIAIRTLLYSDWDQQVYSSRDEVCHLRFTCFNSQYDTRSWSIIAANSPGKSADSLRICSQEETLGNKQPGAGYMSNSIPVARRTVSKN